MFIGFLHRGFIVGGILQRLAHFHIELYLGFRARRTDGYFVAQRVEELKNVTGGGEVELRHVAVDEVGGVQVKIILNGRNGASCQRLGRIGAEFAHHGGYLFGAALARTYHADAAFARETVFQINLYEQLIEVHALVGSPGGNLAHHGDGAHAVFVAAEILGQEAVALLAATQIAGGAFVVAHHVGNPLEARVAVVALNAVGIGNTLYGLGGYNRLDAIFVAGDAAELAVARDDVIEENHHNLVAVYQLIVALFVAHHQADAVGVGVGGEH